ncbi:hypothetical protein ACIP69_18325 [Streptomyces hygroscopicus]|uniref:hypothetical protein n=1 Tax=Streptomyces hygroscopicus TaxID=1912 RepID=UPI00381A5E05
MDRLKKAAARHREEAARQRAAGHAEAADRLEERADELESGRVTDQTDTAIGLIGWALGRR